MLKMLVSILKIFSSISINFCYYLELSHSESFCYEEKRKTNRGKRRKTPPHGIIIKIIFFLNACLTGSFLHMNAKMFHYYVETT